MMNNYPPGVTGNEPQICGDTAWEEFHEGIDKDCTNRGLTDIDAFVVWKLGMSAYYAAKSLDATFPHEPPTH